MHRFDRQRDALAAANAQRDKAAPKTITPHRVHELGGEDCPRCSDRMAVGYRTAFNINYLLGQPELAGDDNGDSRERFVDLCALDGTTNNSIPVM